MPRVLQHDPNDLLKQTWRWALKNTKGITEGNGKQLDEYKMTSILKELGNINIKK